MKPTNDNATHVIVETDLAGRELPVRAPLPIIDADKKWAAEWERDILEPMRRLGRELETRAGGRAA